MNAKFSLAPETDDETEQCEIAIASLCDRLRYIHMISRDKAVPTERRLRVIEELCEAYAHG